MALAYLTVAGLYDYDPELFADVDFPGAGVDKDVIIDQIVYDCGELPLVYTKPDFMRRQLRRWSEVNRLTWQRIYLALTEEYNPLHNYDRHEEWEESGEAESQHCQRPPHTMSTPPPLSVFGGRMQGKRGYRRRGAGGREEDDGAARGARRLPERDFSLHKISVEKSGQIPVRRGAMAGRVGARKMDGFDVL
ncbi:MAG: hypothetical protein II180_13490 [Proteobacteria bacterium]|nr:hypothetical protein [Pseudomonadota bacterium]